MSILPRLDASYGPSIVRTLVPLLVTLIGPWVAHNVGVDSDTLASALGVLVAVVYYAVVRAYETVQPNMGLLLGSKGAPEYSPKHRG